jgi:MtN3 and saliva related transmembrane protein
MVAAALSIIGFIPQAWRIVKTRDTSSLSTPMWIGESAAFALWITYGVMLEKLPIIIPNAICLILSVFILFMKVAPKRTKEHVADALDPAA